MANLIGKFVVKKILKETADNKFGKKDGLFERTPATKMDHANIKFTSNTKKLRKALPPGLTEAEQEVLVKVKRRAYMLDMSLFSLCGLRFGWSSVIGFVPAIGDVLDLLLALMVVRTASEASLPPHIHTKMVFNIILDFLIGLIPFLGDLADAAYKCNTRNAIVLEDYLRQRGQENLRKSGMPAPLDLSLPEEYEQQPELYGAIGALSQQQNGPQYQGGAAVGSANHPSSMTGANRAHGADLEAQVPTHAKSKSAGKSGKGRSSSRR